VALTERRVDLVALLAFPAAVPLGLAAASPLRLYVVAALGGVVLLAGLWVWARRDAPGLLAGLWLFQLVRWPLAGTLPASAAPAVDQLTDVAAVVLLAAFAWELLDPEAQRRDLRFLVPALGLAGAGVASSLLRGAPPAPTLVGMWLTTKLWLLLGVTVAVPWKRADADRVLAVVLGAGAVVAALGIADFATHGQVATALRSNVSFSDISTYRAGAAQAVYGTPNEFNLSMSLLAAIALARVAAGARGRDLWLLALFVAAAVVSLRLKAVLSLAVVFVIVTAVLGLRGRRGAVGLLVAGAVGFVAIYAVDGHVLQQQVANYQSTQSTARTDLYRTGAQIARSDFPFGVGFGRFGSAPSRDHYSPVYDEYGLSRIWGLSRQFPRFIADLSWPAVIGETGVLGVLAYVAGLLALVALAIRRLRAASDAELAAPLALLSVIAVVLVDSTGNSTLFSWTTVTILAIAVAATSASAPAPR
jgi:hypothetical protein